MYQKQFKKEEIKQIANEELDNYDYDTISLVELLDLVLSNLELAKEHLQANNGSNTT